MLPAQQYRRNAAECVLLVDDTLGPDDRLILMQMAAAWLRLAGQSDKDSQPDLANRALPHPIGVKNGSKGRVGRKSTTSLGSGSLGTGRRAL
jgi:hypothetical protein